MLEINQRALAAPLRSDPTLCMDVDYSHINLSFMWPSTQSQSEMHNPKDRSEKLIAVFTPMPETRLDFKPQRHCTKVSQQGINVLAFNSAVSHSR